MNDSTAPGGGHRPAHPSENDLLRTVAAWELPRLIEAEARLLLDECFPGWFEQSSIYAYEYWRRFCQELLLHTLTLVCDTWTCLQPERKTKIMVRPTARGLRTVVNLTGPGEHKQVQIYQTVLAELRRPRNSQSSPSDFTLLHTLRREYTEPTVPFEAGDLEYVEDFAWFYADSWTQNLLERVSWGHPDPYFEALPNL
ncbi:hypothetical protein [Deinococcus xianganensis]|uniref:Uncharacterized protein n=1 Tax=Deinococcus xianganensis TaxID=1507289 RepID=A0A6I4YPW2_9DEIO|nr:hypothetical protein [Deinococcus xianganensis]MXV19173.1 hypothetical protein [Deinococcus xianganensis]